MCNEIIIKHLKGSILASTVTYNYLEQEHKGTCFKITLPLELS